MLVLHAIAALADPLSVDAEVVRPGAIDVVPGVPGAAAFPRGSATVGALAQYERDPLVLMAGDDRIGSVVGNRLRIDALGAAAVSDRVSLLASVPMATQFGSTIADDSADGTSLGDVGAGLRVGLVHNDDSALAARAMIRVPTGARSHWLGEGTVRGEAGLSARFGTDDVAAAVDAGVVLREAVDTGLGVTVGPEGSLAAGVSGVVAPDWTLGGALIARSGFANFLAAGGETALEAVATARWTHGPLGLEVGLGRGIGGGLGTTDFRGIVGVRWTHVPVREIVPVVAHVDPEDLVPDEVVRQPDPIDVGPPPPPAWSGNELARVVGENIVLRDPIRFEVGTVKVVKESLPTLAVVAALVQPDTMLVIEGHSSDEGDFAYNYELSNKRAKSIWEELVKAGVPPSRMSWRGLGEVAPDSGASADLAANRRVVFWLIHLSHPDGAPPIPEGPTLLPWDGTPAPAPVPVPETVPVPLPEGPAPAAPWGTP
jgi:outer membrane protein OmpA-like peptidoglycan-associated protein